MARIDILVTQALADLGPKPPDSSAASVKKNYSEDVSDIVALAFAEELRQRGLTGARPGGSTTTTTGSERRMAGGLGAKNVDVTWATEESGLLLAISVKSINFRDARSRNFQKNLTNRRGDMLFESITLHRRFPYAVLGGFLILDKGAANDGTTKRRSTFDNAHPRFRLFTGRDDPAGRDEQYERIFLMLLDSVGTPPSYTVHRVGDPKTPPVSLSSAFDEMIELLAARNPDFYEAVGGDLVRAR